MRPCLIRRLITKTPPHVTAIRHFNSWGFWYIQMNKCAVNTSEIDAILYRIFSPRFSLDFLISFLDFEVENIVWVILSLYRWLYVCEFETWFKIFTNFKCKFRMKLLRLSTRATKSYVNCIIIRLSWCSIYFFSFSMSCSIFCCETAKILINNFTLYVITSSAWTSE